MYGAVYVNCCRRPIRRGPSAGTSSAAEATSTRRGLGHSSWRSLPPLRASIPTTTTTTIPTQGATAPAAAAGFSNVCNVLMACLSTAPARPVVHQLLLEQQVTLCRLATGAARRSAAAACIEWCLQITRPAAPQGRGSSSTGRMPKERPPGSGRGRQRAASMSPDLSDAHEG